MKTMTLYTIRFSYIDDNKVYFEYTLLASSRDLAIAYAKCYIAKTIGCSLEELVYVDCVL